MGFSTTAQRVRETGWSTIAAVAISGGALLVTVGALPTCSQYQRRDEAIVEYAATNRRLETIEKKLDRLTDYLMRAR